MIQLEVVATVDPVICKEHLYHLNDIQISSQIKTSHLTIEDPSIGDQIILLKVVGDDLHVESIPAHKPYLTNGKKSIGARLHQAGDEITIGKTTLKVVTFQRSQNDHESPLPERYKRASQNPNSAKILETLEAELIHLEYLLNAENE